MLLCGVEARVCREAGGATTPELPLVVAGAIDLDMADKNKRPGKKTASRSTLSQAVVCVRLVEALIFEERRTP